MSGLVDAADIEQQHLSLNIQLLLELYYFLQ